MRSKKCGQIIEEVLLCLVWTISTHSKAPAAAAVVLAALAVPVPLYMDSRDRGRALGHRKTIWIKRNPKEHHRSLGLLFAYSVTSEGAGLQPQTFGYKI